MKNKNFEETLGLLVASKLHEEWRKTQRSDDGSFNPRWKTIKDEEFASKLEMFFLPHNIRYFKNIYEIDIANSYYDELSTDWQKENLDAGKVVASLSMRSENEKLTTDQIGDIIHSEWLTRNQWAKDDKILSKPFSELPEVEKEKDINQFIIAQNVKAELLKNTCKKQNVCK